MAYWEVRVPFEGKATIAIESAKKPTVSEINVYLQRGNFDRGLPRFSITKSNIDKIDEREFKRAKKRMKAEDTVIDGVETLLEELDSIEKTFKRRGNNGNKVRIQGS
ncbi:unnamed protein product [marine sediment metagenome]|uniref:Uncharacterized protein n=1 Tax=marine sediment metagenome TaxID=412755 RepID=X0UKU6_9ZZZZ